jgi:hypothetical protein
VNLQLICLSLSARSPHQLADPPQRKILVQWGIGIMQVIDLRVRQLSDQGGVGGVWGWDGRYIDDRSRHSAVILRTQPLGKIEHHF